MVNLTTWSCGVLCIIGCLIVQVIWSYLSNTSICGNLKTTRQSMALGNNYPNTHACMHARTHTHTHTHIYTHIHTHMQHTLCMDAHYVCMHAMCVCMWVLGYNYVCVHIHMHDTHIMHTDTVAHKHKHNILHTYVNIQE